MNMLRSEKSLKLNNGEKHYNKNNVNSANKVNSKLEKCGGIFNICLKTDESKKNVPISNSMA